MSSGALDLGTVNGHPVVLHAGETFSMSPNLFHHPGNRCTEPAEVEAVLTPGLGAARMFESMYAVVHEHRGLARALRMAIVLDRHRQAVEFPLPVLLAMRVMAKVARLAGFAVD